MKHFPIEGDALPEGKAGWLLFLDEANSAPAAIQAAAYKLVLDKMVGSHRLHKNVAMVLAGNLESDGAIVQPMSTALQSRLLHLELVVDAKEWDEWALAENFNPKITSYIKFKPSQLYTFSADHTDDTYACPRTWEFAQRILEIVPSDSPVLLPMLAGTLTEGVAREFLGFCRIYDDLVTIDQIKANPEGVKVPNEPSVLYAMTGSLAHNMDADNSAVLMKYIARLPLEFQVVCMREVVRRNKAMLANAAVQAWIKDNRDALT